MLSNHITVLGGGPAGLGAGYFARKAGLPFTIYEAQARTGGLAQTIQDGDFRFDTGAHRFHAKDAAITAEVKALLGDDLVAIHAPSHIFHRGRFVDFPLSASSLLKSLSLRTLVAAMADLAIARARRPRIKPNFQQAAVGMYGRTIATEFLLNYSEKLWGLPAARLSVSITGKRLRDLNPMALLREMLLGDEGRPRHLEGEFYYPSSGYGMIVDALRRACGEENIRTNAAVKAVFHEGKTIRAIAAGGDRTIPVAQVVNTLPLPLLLRLLDPPPPAEHLRAADTLRFRNLVLVAFFLDMERVSESASIYFPDASIPFTRAYEPKNRSSRMAPPGKTSLCVEYPCFATDEIWTRGDQSMVEMTVTELERVGLAHRERVLGSRVLRLPHAYPVLEDGIESTVEQLLGYLSGFSNLKVVGRNGRFAYSHVHDMLRFGLDVINELSGSHVQPISPS